MIGKTKSIVLCALSVAVLAVCAQISIPMPSGVAVTLQTLAAALCGFLLGSKRAATVGAAYILLGAIGVPVFSALGGGTGVLFGHSGGFLLCLPLFCALCGLADYVNQKAFKILLLLSSLLLLHIVGTLWYSAVTGNGILMSFLSVSVIYLPKDIASVAAAYFITKRIKNYI